MVQTYRGRAKTLRRWDPADLTGARLGIYTRASDDSDDTETSVTGQERFGVRWAEQQGITAITRYCDNDKSASHYARKEREDFRRMLRDVEAGKLDLLWFWTLSRSQRRLDVYVQLRDLCRIKGVGWVIKRRLYDLNEAADRRALGVDAVNAEYQSDEISENVTLGMELAASQGRPHGPVTYGFRREYDGRGKYVGQFPDETTAPIVREIIRRIAAGHPIIRIQESLAQRGIPSPKGHPTWSRSVITRLAMNPSYLGKRVHQGKVLDHAEPCWEPIMKEPADVQAFYAATNILTDPERKTTRPSRGRHLLSYIALCDEPGCGRALKHSTAKQYI